MPTFSLKDVSDSSFMRKTSGVHMLLLLRHGEYVFSPSAEISTVHSGILKDEPHQNVARSTVRRRNLHSSSCLRMRPSQFVGGVYRAPLFLATTLSFEWWLAEKSIMIC